jgi:murein DD-endopeptidase MepM/ murein hydrolase activator NlpD
VLALLAPLVAWTDYLSLLRQRRDMASLQGLAGEQDQVLQSVRRRLLQLQDEMASWRAMHARIWEPLGPEAPGAGERTGVGGVGRPVTDPGNDAGWLVLQVEQLAASVADEGQKLRALDGLMARAGTVLAALPTRWPVRGTVNSEFGQRLSPWTGVPETHSGIDIAAEIGTPVRAPAPGVVAFAGGAPDYGTTLVIDHGHDIKTLFGHLQTLQVVTGQKVERGQTIALTGNTGKSSGPHLHYEITVRGQAVNPRGYLWD